MTKIIFMNSGAGDWSLGFANNSLASIFFPSGSVSYKLVLKRF